MKIYEQESKEKSWSIQLKTSTEKVSNLFAVDSKTGEHIAVLLRFQNNGAIESLGNAESLIKEKGYNPDEHSNQWDKEGRLEIDNG